LCTTVDKNITLAVSHHIALGLINVKSFTSVGKNIDD